MTKEADVSNAVASTDVQLGKVERNLGDVHLAEAADEQGQDRDDVRNIVRQLEDERAALGCSRSLLETLLLKTRTDAVTEAATKNQKRSTKMTFGNNNSGFQAGIINDGVSGLSFGAK